MLEHTLHLKQVSDACRQYHGSSFSQKSEFTCTKIIYKISWNTKTCLREYFWFLCLILIEMILQTFLRIWLVSAYIAFETIVQIHVGDKCDSSFFLQNRMYNNNIYKQNHVITCKETIRSLSYDNELYEFSVLLWIGICNCKHNIQLKR